MQIINNATIAVAEKLSNIAKLIAKSALNHKKKLIFLLAIYIMYKWARKNLTFNHILYIFQKLVVLKSQFFPQLQDEKMRDPNSYDPQPYEPLYQLIKLIRVQEISQKIKKKQEGSWQELKLSIFTGITTSLTLYNSNHIFDVIKQKYMPDFRIFEQEYPMADKYFEFAIESIKKKFIQSLEIKFATIRENLFEPISFISLKDKLTFQEISQNLQGLVKKIFQTKYDYHESIHQRFWFRRYQDEASRKKDRLGTLFYTNLDTECYVQNKKALPKMIIKQSISMIGNIISTAFHHIVNFFPEPQYEVSSQRFDFTGLIYSLFMKKISSSQLMQEFVHTFNQRQERNNQLEKFTQMILSQAQQIFESLSFQTLIYEFSQYNLNIFLNRVKMFMKRSKLKQIKVAQLLPVCYKILKQQIHVSREKRQRYYQAQLQKAFRILVHHKNVDQNRQEQQFNIENLNNQSLTPQQQEQVQNRNEILDQLYMHNQYCYLQKQFELKYFHERSGISFAPSASHSKEKKEKREVQSVLSMISNVVTTQN